MSRSSLRSDQRTLPASDHAGANRSADGHTSRAVGQGPVGSVVGRVTSCAHVSAQSQGSRSSRFSWDAQVLWACAHILSTVVAFPIRRQLSRFCWIFTGSCDRAIWIQRHTLCNRVLVGSRPLELLFNPLGDPKFGEQVACTWTFMTHDNGSNDRSMAMET